MSVVSLVISFIVRFGVWSLLGSFSSILLMFVAVIIIMRIVVPILVIVLGGLISDFAALRSAWSCVCLFRMCTFGARLGTVEG